MSGALFIGPDEEAAIKSALDIARANVTPWSALKGIAHGDPSNTLMFNERKGALPATASVMLGTYRVCISFEDQPVGLCRHLSASAHQVGMVPGEVVMKMICEAFGFKAFPPQPPGRVWFEEYRPGRMALNVVELVEP